MESNPELYGYYEEWLKHDMFESVRDKIVSIEWSQPSSFPKTFECWAWAQAESTNCVTIRLNTLTRELQAPDYVILYLVAHEMIHMLPGCGAHNEVFWNHEISLLGEAYYEAAIWLRQHRHCFTSHYAYRRKAWLKEMVEQDQLRIKDMAEICGCHPSTIRRWLRKYELYIKH